MRELLVWTWAMLTGAVRPELEGRWADRAMVRLYLQYLPETFESQLPQHRYEGRA
jgi:hypothetical protein